MAKCNQLTPLTFKGLKLKLSLECGASIKAWLMLSLSDYRLCYTCSRLLLSLNLMLSAKSVFVRNNFTMHLACITN